MGVWVTGRINRRGAGRPRSAIFRISCDEQDLLQDSQSYCQAPGNSFDLKMKDATSRDAPWQAIGAFPTSAASRKAAEDEIGHSIPHEAWQEISPSE